MSLDSFFNDCQKKRLICKGNVALGVKYSKIRLTGLAAGNVVGEKLPMFTNGKSVRKEGLEALCNFWTVCSKFCNTNDMFVTAIREKLPKCIFENYEIALVKRRQFQRF